MGTENQPEKKVHFLVTIAYWAVIVAIVYLIFKYVLNLLMPFFLAFLFAAVVRPISRWLSREYRWKKNAAGEKVQVRRRFRMNRNLAGVISVIVLFLILGGLLALVMGSEGEGMRRLTREACDFVARIPMRGSVESLNVSVSTGVALFEALRQRAAPAPAKK